VVDDGGAGAGALGAGGGGDVRLEHFDARRHLCPAAACDGAQPAPARVELMDERVADAAARAEDDVEVWRVGHGFSLGQCLVTKLYNNVML
jgi:hypothetical protein